MFHTHTLSHTDMVEQWGLLCRYRHVNHHNVRIVEIVQNGRLTKVKLLELNILKRGISTETQYKILGDDC